MKTNTLKTHTEKKCHYALKAFGLGALMIALFVVPCMIKDKGMYLYYGDYLCQIMPFYQIMSDAIRTGNVNWSWYTDLGTPLVGGYSFYNLGSPFFWMMVPFPVDWIPYLMGPLTILKFGIASLGAYIYLKRYVKDKNNAVIGGLLYAFSGFAIYSLVFHFEDSLALFPFMIAALDSFMYEKKRGLFALTVMLCCVTNFYFFIAEAIFLMIYWIVRMSVKSFKAENAKEVIFLIFEAVLGVGMSLFLFLPSIYHIVGNNRVSTQSWSGWNFWVYENVHTYVQLILSFFAPPELAGTQIYTTEYKTSWLSITGYLPLFSMSGVFVVIFNKNRNKWIRILYAVSTIVMFVPILNSTFQMFTEAKYVRWFFMLLLIMSLGSVMALEDAGSKWKKAIILNLVLTVILTLIIAGTPYRIGDGTTIHILFGLSEQLHTFWLFMSVALFNIALLALFISLYKKDPYRVKKFGICLTSVAIIVTMASSFVLSKKLAVEKLDVVGDHLLNQGYNVDIDDIQDWRSDILTYSVYSEIMFDKEHAESYSYDEITNITTQRVADIQNSENSKIYTDDDNLNMFWRIPGLECFHSTVSGSISRFFDGMGFTRNTLSNWPVGMYGLRSLFSVKYMFNEPDSSLSFETEDTPSRTLMPGWKYLKNTNSFNVYENEYCIPMGITFDNYISEADFEKIPLTYRHLVLLKALVVGPIDDMVECTAMGMEQLDKDDFDFTEAEYYKNCQDRIASACYEFSRDNKGFSAKIETGDKEEMVLFTVPFDNGWSAQVNGSDAKIYMTDFGFMAVKVPANMKSTIRFNYHIPGILYGTFVAALCLIMLVIYLAALKIQSTSDTDEVDENSESTTKENTDTDVKTNEQTSDVTADKKPEEQKEEACDNTADTKAEEVTESDNAGTNDENSSGFLGLFKTNKAPQASQENESAENKVSDTANAEDEDITLFDIVKQTEEQNMMHVYDRIPVVLEKGYGSTAWDIYDKKYIDFTSGIGVNALGYSHPSWQEAVVKQINSLPHMSNIYYNTTQIQLAELLCMKTGFSKVFFANSGAEANECAVKIARKYGSDKYGEDHTQIVTLKNSFHGRTITTLSATGQEVFHKFFTPFTEGFAYADADSIDSINEQINENTCAVMIELVQGEGGVMPLSREFVTELYELCKEKDILLIVDEIQTGMGRTGKLFCYENYDIVPDIITSAKALAGGLPLSACLCSEKLADVMGKGTNGTTFGGNPAACAGAMKVLEFVSDEEFLQSVNEKGEYMRKHIEAMNGVKAVRGLGLMIGIELDTENIKQVQLKCAENGLLVLTAKGVLRLLPPLNIDYFDIDAGLELLERSIGEVIEGES